MVILVVKGTKVPDEFVVEVPCTAQCGETAQKLCDIQNARLRVRLQLYSAADLCKELKARESELDASSQATLLEYSKLQSEVYAAMRNPKLVVREKEYEGHWTRMRDLTVTLFPQPVHLPGGTASCHRQALPNARRSRNRRRSAFARLSLPFDT